MAAGDIDNYSLDPVFAKATEHGIGLFFSFDYAGNGAWDKETVLSLLQKYTSYNAYYRHEGVPLVSTFEGPGSAYDWLHIKANVEIFFIPDWSSVGAKAAVKLAGGVADGLFSWAAWPTGPNDMDTYVDASYMQYLEGKPYMMPVSPWFFTNMPGYNKNWLWRGDDLWHTRWQQALYIAPEFIEIISWNDFGESHYIGPNPEHRHPLGDPIYTAFDTGEAPYNYAASIEHIGWLELLPFLTEMYRNNKTNTGAETLVGWYRLNLAGACADGGTTGNTASQLQLEYRAHDMVQDKIFYSAVVSQPSDITVTVGGVSLGATWTDTPSGDVGLYHGSVSFTGHSGPVVISVTTPTSGVITFQGEDISSSCAVGDKVENWNAHVGTALGALYTKQSADLADEVCVKGWGKGNFMGLCEFACSLGYCPVGACVCTKLGPHPKLPPATGVNGYPAAGLDANYAGLCAFACEYGYCPPGACGTVPAPLTIPTVSPFTPDTCVGGTGEGALAGLCSFACNFGYCPIYNCTCTATGPLNKPPKQDTPTLAWAPDFQDNGLCDFACTRDYCPSPTCLSDSNGSPCGSVDSDEGCGDDLPCDYSLSYDSVEKLQSDLDKDPDLYASFCVSYYMLGALSGELESIMKNYTHIADTKDYDDDFKNYITYMEQLTQSKLRTMMSDGLGPSELGPGNKFFDCYWSNKIEDRNAITSWTACPVEYVSAEDVSHVIYYRLKDQEGFNATLLSDYSIQPDWVTVNGGLLLPKSYYYGPLPATQLSGHYDPGEDPKHPRPGGESHMPHIYYDGYPNRAEHMNINDPREAMRQAAPKVPIIQTEIMVAQLEILSGSFDGVIDDVVQTLSTAVYTIAEMVDRMQSVIKIGEEVAEEKKKAKILEIIGAVCMALPFLGPVAELGEVAEAVVAIVSFTATLGNEALGLYSIIEDPASAPVAILGMILDFNLGAKGAKVAGKQADGSLGSATYRDLAATRRGMAADKATSFGKLFKEKTDLVTKLTQKCARR